MVPIPSNLPLLLGQATKDSQRQVLETILKGRDDLKQNLYDLGQFWDVRVWFSQPVERRFPRRWAKVSVAEGTTGYGVTKTAKSSVVDSEHVFHGFFTYDNGKVLCYKPFRNSRHGYPFPSLELVTRYEPVIDGPAAPTFQTLQQFQSKFDPQFITQTEILKLWNGKSGQHGGKYKPSDFHRIGPRGRGVLEQFLTGPPIRAGTPRPSTGLTCPSITAVPITRVGTSQSVTRLVKSM